MHRPCVVFGDIIAAALRPTPTFTVQTRQARATPSEAILNHAISVTDLDYQLTYTSPRQANKHWDFFTLSKSIRTRRGRNSPGTSRRRRRRRNYN
eukprot:807578-Pyramimonas_sp.AAC.1